MSVKVADKIVQMNNQDYPLMDASAVNYDNSDSGLLSTEVQGAIDELAGITKSLEMPSIALEQPISVEVKGCNGYIELKWTDPDDVIVGSTTLATWKKTVVVRKEGSAPSSETDGTIIVESTTRNEYSTTPFKDDGLVNGTIYYYGIFPCTTENVYTTTYTTFTYPVANLKIVTFADGTDEEIVRMIQGHYNDEINIADYWSIGDMRTIHIDAMEAIGVGEAHIAQDQQFVIIGIDHDDLETEINGHTKAAITIQPLRVLSNGTSAESGYMNPTETYVGGWKECARRKWCNDVFVNALPIIIQNDIKPVIKLNYKPNSGTDITTTGTNDKAFLLSETETFGAKHYSAGTTEGTQYEYYKTSGNLIKYIGNATTKGSAIVWWERSPCYGGDKQVSYVSDKGINANSYGYFANYTNYCFCPAFCL